MVLDATCTFEGPLTILAVSVMVPATVPVSSEIGPPVNTAVVAFAAIVKSTVRDPDENSVAGSSIGTSAVEENIIVSCPVSAVGWGAARVSVTLETTCVGVTFAGRLGLNERAATGGSTVNMNPRLVPVAASVRVTVNCCEP